MAVGRPQCPLVKLVREATANIVLDGGPPLVVRVVRFVRSGENTVMHWVRGYSDQLALKRLLKLVKNSDDYKIIKAKELNNGLMLVFGNKA